MDVTAIGAGLILLIALFKGSAGQIMKIRCITRAKQRPIALFGHPLHEKIWDPVSGIHVVGPATIITGILAKLEKFFDIDVPGFKIGTHRAQPLTALINGNRGIVRHFQKRDHPLRLAVRPLDVGAETPDSFPIVA